MISTNNKTKILETEIWSEYHVLETLSQEKYLPPDTLSNYTPEAPIGPPTVSTEAPQNLPLGVPSQNFISNGQRSQILWLARNSQDQGSTNPKLLEDISIAGGRVGIKTITVSAAFSDHGATTTSGNKSRHQSHNALDLGLFNGEPVGGKGQRGTPNEVNLKIKSIVDQFVSTLESMGYKRGEGGNDRAALWYFNDVRKGGNHFNHVHVSRISRQ